MTVVLGVVGNRSGGRPAKTWEPGDPISTDDIPMYSQSWDWVFL